MTTLRVVGVSFSSARRNWIKHTPGWVASPTTAPFLIARDIIWFSCILAGSSARLLQINIKGESALLKQIANMWPDLKLLRRIKMMMQCRPFDLVACSSTSSSIEFRIRESKYLLYGIPFQIHTHDDADLLWWTLLTWRLVDGGPEICRQFDREVEQQSQYIYNCPSTRHITSSQNHTLKTGTIASFSMCSRDKWNPRHSAASDMPFSFQWSDRTILVAPLSPLIIFGWHSSGS